MRVVFFVVMALFCHNNKVIAQSLNARAEAVADKFCTCVNSTYSNIDGDVKKSMAKIISYKLQNQPQDLERYMKRLSAELVIRIQEQAMTFKRNGALAQHCIHSMEMAMQAIDLADPLYEGITEEKFSHMIQQELKDSSCEFAALLLELGLKERPSKQQVRIGQTRSRETAGTR